jgi:hypothetical protein
MLIALIAGGVRPPPCSNVGIISIFPTSKRRRRAPTQSGAKFGSDFEVEHLSRIPKLEACQM